MEAITARTREGVKDDIEKYVRWLARKRYAEAGEHGERTKAYTEHCAAGAELLKLAGYLQKLPVI